MKQKRNRDIRVLKAEDAVSNVVVMMLILSVIVIAFSVFVGIYLPQMKETSEMMHSEDVKSAFLKFSSDMDSVYSRGQAGTYSEVFSLGGGEILLSSSKSAGTVEIESEELAKIIIPYTKKESPDTISLKTVKISYTPVLPFWEEQGYWYENGVVWVQKRDVNTPVSSSLYSIRDGVNLMNQTADSWIQMMKPVYLTENKTFTVTKDSEDAPVISENIQYIYTMTLVNVFADENHSFLSGSGYAALKISAEIQPAVMEYELTDTPLELNGKEIHLAKGTLPSLLRVTKIDVKVSVE